MNPSPTKLPIYGAGFEIPHEYDEDPAFEAALEHMELVEIIPEGFFHGKRARLLKALADRGTPVVVHSIDMSMCEDAPFRAEHFDQVRRVMDAVNCVFFSDHICMTRAGGIEIGQLTTVPFTEAVVDVFCRKVDEIRRRVGDGVGLMFENITNRFIVPHSTMSETQFLNAVTRKSGVGLLLDVTNAYTNSVNFKFDARAWIDALDASSIVGIHLAGGEWEQGKLYDSHSRAVPRPVWELYDYVAELARLRAVIVEWDQDPPPVAALLTEVARAARSMGRSGPACVEGFVPGAERRFKSLRRLSEGDDLQSRESMRGGALFAPRSPTAALRHEVAAP